MGLWSALTLRDTATALTAALEESGDVPRAAAPRGTGDLQALYDASTARRAAAMRVPALRRATTLVGTNIGTLRITCTSPSGPVDTPPLLRRPDPTRTLAAVLGDTAADLALHGAAYWINPAWSSRSGWRWPDLPPGRRKHASLRRVAPEDIQPANGEPVFAYDGTHRAEYQVTDSAGVGRLLPSHAVVAFETVAGGWLADGAGVIETAGALDASVRAYARTPQPQAVLRNAGPRRNQAQIDELLDAYETARRTRTTAYVGRDLELSMVGFDAQQTALVESRQQLVLDVARLTGIPALYLSAVPDGSSMTYTNATQARLDLHAALQPFAVAIEQRLSFEDVTGDGTEVRLDFGPWLRVDPSMRAALYAQLIPLGVMTVEEARVFEDMAATGTPGAGEAAASGGSS